MPEPLHLAFVWHMHQPDYREPFTRAFFLPWVRMHATKDYSGMALLIEETPGMKATVNFVPSLVDQIAAYVAGATDRLAESCALPPEKLDRNGIAALLDSLFMANIEHVVGAFPRYRELFDKRDFRSSSATEAARRFTAQDVRDLQVLWNLAWVHPILRATRPAIAALVDKGRGFTEEEKATLAAEQRTLIAEVLPRWRRLAEAGRVELTTTPYYHPILPLLIDMESAREAMPRVALPTNRFRNVEDARVHVRRAAEAHERTFGARPRGMWPAEGSVSSEAIPIFAEHGVRWIATDEEILGASLGRSFLRDAAGDVIGPAPLYRPHLAEHGGASVAIIFRDHYLSDLMGFQYQRWEPRKAAQDFVARLRRIRAAVPAGPALVSVILDGENAWEHYPENAVPFFRAVYKAISEEGWIVPTTVSDYLDAHPPADRLPRLAAGSWIAHNFSIWIGHHEDRAAWEALYRARVALVDHAKAGSVPPEKLAAAWEEIYCAEGSDWFWWFGDDHHSSNDAEFDYLFRRHLARVYDLVGLPHPKALDEPIKRTHHRATFTVPRGMLAIEVDGRVTSYFEWHGAGHYAASTDVVAMERALKPVVTDIHFGCGKDAVFFRLDFAGEAAIQMGRDLAVRLRLQATDADPRDLLIPLEGPTPAREIALPVPHRYAIQSVLEVSVPLAELGATPGKDVKLHCEILERGEPTARLPASSIIIFKVPDPALAQADWVV